MSVKHEIPRFEAFSIVESEKTKGEIYISPDIAICEDCARELYDPADRRYLHPFINCTCCGPRLTILDALPYDRERTSMKMFPMCRSCAEEYHSSLSRRYDAQPVCCNECGPEVYLLPVKNSAAPGTAEQNTRGRAAITAARRTILEGGIVAVKGIGGFHLCCDAGNEDAVRLLRARKHRPAKPFAVMMRDEQTVQRECELNGEQRRILTGHQKPILLLERKKAIFGGADTSPGSGQAAGCEPPDGSEGHLGNQISQRHQSGVAPSVAPGNPKIGVMLPYAPLQLLLFSYPDGLEMPDCLVMTSGNVSGAPICRDDADALAELSHFCDCILSHDRLIRIRADDTVMDFYGGHPYMIRRSRGYAPLPVLLSEEWGQAAQALTRFPAAAGGCSTPALYTEAPDVQMSAAGKWKPRTGNSGSVNALQPAAEGWDVRVDTPRGQALSCVLAVGGELKNTFCIAAGNLYYLSPYIGDLEDLRTVRALQETIGRMETLLEAVPQAVVCDLHPKYNSSEAAEEIALQRHIPLYRIQHHYAHVLSCMAENDYPDPVIGVSFDGTGYGTDGTIWGGEILTADICGFSRSYSIAPFTQIGGDSASRQGWRIAASMILDVCKKKDPEKSDKRWHPAQGAGKSGICGKNTPQGGGKRWRPAQGAGKSGICGKNSPQGGGKRWHPAQGTGKSGICGKNSLQGGGEEAYFEIMDRLSICDPSNAGVQRMMAERGIQAIPSTSAGRLFDAVSAMLGICRESTYEGEASIKLEFAAERFLEKGGIQRSPAFGNEDRHEDRHEDRYEDRYEDRREERYDDRHEDCHEDGLYGIETDFPEDSRHLPTDALFASLLSKRLAGEDPEQLAWEFHDVLAALIAEAVRRTAERTGIRTAALTGGCFQNTLLLSLTEERLRRAGIRVLIHHLVPPNDGGIALGQAAAVLAGSTAGHER